MSQPEDREFYRDARDGYHNAMQKLTAGVFSKALKLDADGRPKAEQRATICELFETAVAAVPAAAEAAGRAPAPERQRLARQSPPTRADLLWGVTAATSESPAAGGDRGAAVSPPPREGGEELSAGIGSLQLGEAHDPASRPAPPRPQREEQDMNELNFDDCDDDDDAAI